MKLLLKITAALFFGILVFNQISKDTNNEVIKNDDIQEKVENSSEAKDQTEDTGNTREKIVEKLPEGDYWVNDSICHWDEVMLDFLPIKSSEESITQQAATPFLASSTSLEDDTKPLVINWELLLDIEYRLKYFKKLDMEIYAPIFPDALKAIDGKEVIIEGFIIPFDESGELLALSANPFASCFFCGKASPASVLSLYLKRKKRYKMDDFRKFRGVLHLNTDDPEEYYYILKKATPTK